MIIKEKVCSYTKNLKVLYVEDNESFKLDALKVFNNFFQDIDLAKDGKDGLEKYNDHFKLNQKYYDLVITDIEMPHMNGVELVQNLYKENAQQKIIVISAHNNSKYLMEFINMGIAYFLLKPFTIDKILETFEKVLVSTNKLYIRDNLYYNKQSKNLFFNNNLIKLTKKELLFLELLIINKNNVVSIDTIFDYVWNYEIDYCSNKIFNPFLSKLKKKLPVSFIDNIYGLGYSIKL